MNPQLSERQVVSPDYAGWHDLHVSEIHEVHQGFSLLKCILEFVVNSRIPGIVAVGALFVLSRIGCAVTEAKELTNNGLLGALAIALMTLLFGGTGLYLEWKHHATNREEPPDLPAQSRNGGIGTAEAGSSP